MGAHRRWSVIGAAAWAVAASLAHAEPFGPGLDPRTLSGRIEAIQALPGGSWSAVRLRGQGGLFFLSANGRFAVRGEVYDLWSGRRLETFADLQDAATRLDLSGLEAFWDDLAPVVVGEGSREATVFVDPLCPVCRALLARLEPFFATHRFRIVEIPALGQASGQKVRAAACATDETATRRAVLGELEPLALAQRADCDLAPLQRRLVVAQLIGVTEVPFLILGDGRIAVGLDDGLEAFLAEPDDHG